MDQQRFKKSNRDKSPRGRLLIQHYIYDLQARSGGESRQLPSSRELAAQFGVSRCTVTRELEKLVRDGVLVTKQGIGTFLAPVAKTGPAKKRIIGLLFGYGINHCYSEYGWKLIAASGTVLIEHHCLVRPMSISSGEEEGFYQELCENFVDGLIWFAPPEERFPIIRRISRQLPTVVFGSSVPEECNSITIDYTGESYQEGKKLLQEGRSSFWAVQQINDSGVKSYLRGYRKAFEEAGKVFDSGMIFTGDNTLPVQLKETLQSGKRPDIFFIHAPNLREKTVRLLQEFHIDFQQECRLICGGEAGKIPGFAGWCHEQPYREIGEVAADMLLRQFAGDNRLEHRKLVTKHIAINLKEKGCV